MARWMSTVRSARIGFLLAVQDLAQLGAIYGREGRQIIVTDCSTKIALAKTSADDAEWFSRGTGTATVLSYTAGDSRRRGDRLARSGSRGVSEIARPLLTPGEVTRLREDTMLVLSGNRQPLLVTQRRWYQDRHLRKLGRLRPEPGTPPVSGGRAGRVPTQDRAIPRREEELRTARGAPDATVAASTVDDGAVVLDGNHPAGQATWVPAPEDRAETQGAAPVTAGAEAPATADAVPAAAVVASASGFELPEDG